MGKSIQQILEELNSKKEQERIKLEREEKERLDKVKKLNEHRRYLDKIYENLSPSAGAGAGAGGTSFRTRNASTIPVWRRPTPLVNGLVGPGFFKTTATVSITNMSKIKVEFYIDNIVNDSDDVEYIFTNRDSGNNPTHYIRRNSNAIIYKIPNEQYSISVGSVDDLVHELIIEYDETLDNYKMTYDDVEYISTKSGTYSASGTVSFNEVITVQSSNNNVVNSNGSYVKNLTFYDNTDNIIFDFTNQFTLNGGTYIYNGFEFIGENRLYSPPVNQSVNITCTVSTYPTTTEYQNVLDYWNNSGFVLPTSQVQDRQNAVVKTLVDNNIWDKLDRFILFSSNGDKNTQYTDYKNPNSGIGMTGPDRSDVYKGVDGAYLKSDSLTTATYFDLKFDPEIDVASFSYTDYTIGVVGNRIYKNNSVSHQQTNYFQNAKLDTILGSNNIAILHDAYGREYEYSVNSTLTPYPDNGVEPDSIHHFNLNTNSNVGKFYIDGNVVATQSATLTSLNKFVISTSFTFGFGGNIVSESYGGNNEIVYQSFYYGASLTEGEQTIIYNAINDYLTCLNVV